MTSHDPASSTCTHIRSSSSIVTEEVRGRRVTVLSEVWRDTENVSLASAMESLVTATITQRGELAAVGVKVRFWMVSV